MHGQFSAIEGQGCPQWVKLVKPVAYNTQYVGALTYNEEKERGGGGGIGSYHKVPKRNQH